MKKLVRAVEPYRHPHGINFKTKAFEAWVKAGGQVAESHYPPRWAHHFAYRYELPTIWKNKKEARLRFVEPVSISFDTFPDYSHYEIIPFIWDCWPKYFGLLKRWLKKYDVQSVILTSSQIAEKIRDCFPKMNILYIPEGIDTTIYSEGYPLKDRSIDLLEYGRPSTNVCCVNLPLQYNHLQSQAGVLLFKTQREFHLALENAKVSIALPQSMTNPDVSGGLETLTQRYWEMMLSRIVMVGKAPQELVSYLGYNPVIDIDLNDANEQIIEILRNIQEYQSLVDKNREVALKMAGWDLRISRISSFLYECGYCL